MNTERTETTERTGCIYLIHNTVNDKCYVGWTVNFEQRMRDHRNCTGNCRLLIHAVRKHGWEVFAVYKLHDGIPVRYAEIFEVAYIADYDTFHNGYNLTPGGRLRHGFTHSEEARQKVSDANQALLERGEHWLQNETPDKKAARVAKQSATKQAKAVRGELYMQNEPPDKKAARIAKMAATQREQGEQGLHSSQREDVRTKVSATLLRSNATNLHDAQMDAGQQFAVDLPLVDVDRRSKLSEATYYKYRQKRIQAMPDNETQLELL